MSDIQGYKKLSQEKIDTVNSFKILEEALLRDIEDALKDAKDNDEDPRSLQIAFTKFQEAFMWLNRGVMNPSRIRLPEDDA